MPFITKQDILGVSPYDYIEDKSGWIYVAKVLLPDGSIVAKAFYNYSSPDNIVKCKETFCDIVRQPEMPLWEFGGPMDYILLKDDILRVHKHDKYPILTYPKCGDVVYKIASLADECNVRAYLFGSRRLGIENESSDWDILFIGDMSPFLLVNKIIDRLKPEVRLFLSTECNDRAKRYAQRKQFDYITLCRMFSKTTFYLRTNNNEIGVFFSHAKQSVIPTFALTNEKSNLTLNGRILKSDGSSAFLPREFFIKDSTGKKSRIGTVLWEICGIEAHAGSTIELSGVNMLNDGSYWIGGKNAALRFCDD